jgi:D-serine deaminase-like pyridoxal phosphate-dependent protein
VSVHAEPLLTPYLLVDLDVVERNLRRMQAYCNAHGIRLRPHVKTHKLPQLARRQVELGAVGITCQKLTEAEAMASAGLTDILISYNVLGEVRLRRLASLRRRARITAVADSVPVVEGLAWAAALSPAAGPLPVLVEVDAVGYGRTGVGTPAEAVALAREIAARPTLRFAGLMAYPHRPEARAWIREAVSLLTAHGLPPEVVSSGGTPAAWTAHETPEVNEYRVGTYVYNDRMMMDRGAATLADCALRVVSTVVAVHGAGRVVVDAGSKALSSDLLRPGWVEGGYGLIEEYPGARIHALSEEHGHCDFRDAGRLPVVGEIVHIVPNHVCAAVNLYDRVALARGGRIEEVVPIPARGCSQ